MVDRQKAYYRKLRRQLFYQQIGKIHRKIWLDRRAERHVQILAVLFFSGFVLIITIGMRTLISWIAISRFYAAFAVLFSLIPLKFYPLIYRIRKEMKVLFSVFGIAPFLTGLLLVINFVFSSNSRHEIYRIQQIHYYPSDHLFEVELENGALDISRELRRFSSDKILEAPVKVDFEVKQGLLGMKTVQHIRLISPSDSCTIVK